MSTGTIFAPGCAARAADDAVRDQAVANPRSSRSRAADLGGRMDSASEHATCGSSTPAAPEHVPALRVTRTGSSSQQRGAEGVKSIPDQICGNSRNVRLLARVEHSGDRVEDDRRQIGKVLIITRCNPPGTEPRAEVVRMTREQFIDVLSALPQELGWRRNSFGEQSVCTKLICRTRVQGDESSRSP